MTAEHYARFLAHLPVFKGLNAEEIADVARVIQIEQKHHGDRIFTEGQPGDCMYIVESGCVQVTKKTAQGDDQELARPKAPTIIGEMALLDGSPRSASVFSVGEVQLYRIDGADFNLLRRNYRPAAYKVIRNLAMALCERLREVNGMIDGFFADPEKSLDRLRQRQSQLWQQRRQGRG